MLRAVECCPNSRQAMHVYALGCGAFIDSDEADPIEAFHILSFIKHLPERAVRLFATKATGYFRDHAHEGETPYLMNHCRCGAQLDDGSLHWDADAAFSPDTPEVYDTSKLFRLPIEESIAIRCAHTLGDGEYLSTEEAQIW